jgi:hypothetical protein
VFARRRTARFGRDYWPRSQPSPHTTPRQVQLRGAAKAGMGHGITQFGRLAAISASASASDGGIAFRGRRARTAPICRHFSCRRRCSNPDFRIMIPLRCGSTARFEWPRGPKGDMSASGRLLREDERIRPNDWKHQTEQLDQLVTFRQALRLVGKEPEIPLAFSPPRSLNCPVASLGNGRSRAPCERCSTPLWTASSKDDSSP